MKYLRYYFLTIFIVLLLMNELSTIGVFIFIGLLGYFFRKEIKKFLKRIDDNEKN